jgi:hypothetical protein
MLCDNVSRLHQELSVNHDVIVFLYITFSLVGMFIQIRDESHILNLEF